MQDNIAGFLGGFIAGSLGAVRLFTWPIQIHTGNVASDMAIDFTIKLLGTIIIGFIGGLTGLATKDVYKILKDKYYKRKK